MDWHTDFMPQPKELNPNKCQKFFQKLGATDSVELNQFFYKGSFTYFDRLSFQVQIEKKQTLFAVTKQKIVQTGVFTYQPKICDWITSTDNSNSRCKDDKKYLTENDSWSLKIEENSLEYDEKLDEFNFESHTFTSLHSLGFVNRTPKYHIVSTGCLKIYV